MLYIPAIRRITKTVITLTLITVISACGGNSGDTDNNDSPNENPPNDPEDEAAIDPEDEQPMDPNEQLTINVGDAVSNSVGEDETLLYQVPQGAQVVLESLSGNADLYLLDDDTLSIENLVCAAALPYEEDICSATLSDGQLFAAIYGRDASDFTLSVTDDCSIASQNQWVYRSMKDYYLFADQVPVVDPGAYESPSALIADLRFNEQEPFSSVRDATAQSARSDEGKEIGFGHRWRRDANGDLRIIYVHTDSPFGMAGVERGDVFSSLNNVLDQDLTNELFFDFIGTPDAPLLADWSFVDGDTGSTFTFSAAMAEHSINTVMSTSVITPSSFSGRIGYMVLNAFLETSEDEINRAFDFFLQEGATELVLDLRYNGGGRTRVARRLASQIAGPVLDGLLLARYEYNDKYQSLLRENFFEAAGPTMALSKIVVLTTQSTASASELIVNSLRPYIDVVTIGERSRGKPFSSVGRDFCGMTINAMDSQGVNASNISVAGGIPADCYSQDDLSSDFVAGSQGIEGMLSDGIAYLTSGTCNSEPAIAAGVRHSHLTPSAWELAGQEHPSETMKPVEALPEGVWR